GPRLLHRKGAERSGLSWNLLAITLTGTSSCEEFVLWLPMLPRSKKLYHPSSRILTTRSIAPPIAKGLRRPGGCLGIRFGSSATTMSTGCTRFSEVRQENPDKIVRMGQGG